MPEIPRVNQKFCNVIKFDSTGCFYRCEVDETLWIMTCQARLILSEYYSPDLPRLWRWWTTLDSEMPSSPNTLRISFYSTAVESTLLYLPDLDWSSYDQSVIFPTICLLYCDQLHFPLSFKTFFCCFDGVIVQFELVNHDPELDKVVHSSVRLSNHTRNEAKKHVSVPTTTILPTIFGTYCFGHMIYGLQTSTYQNISKLLFTQVKRGKKPWKEFYILRNRNFLYWPWSLDQRS